MTYRQVDEVDIDPATASVYEHGWQSWSPTDRYAATDTSARPGFERHQTMRFRPGKHPPAVGFQGEGLLVVDPGTGRELSVYSARDPRAAVASIRALGAGGKLVISTDGDVDVRRVPGGLGDALAAAGDDIAGTCGAGPLRDVPTVWCSWYHYFEAVTQGDIVENLDLIDQHELPVQVVQIDDGWQAGIGDWDRLSDRFTSLSDLAAHVRDRGRTPGIWVAPFIVGERSDLARQHPDWLAGDAGFNWDQRLFGVDLTHPGVRDHLTQVFGELRRLGFGYVKLDFLYGGAMPGDRYEDADPVAAYRSGLELIRNAVGPDIFLLGCGAPILPSVGVLDAMRVSPDSFNPADAENGSDLLRGRSCIEGRAWQHGRFWTNDADCLVARPGFARRDEWARVVSAYSGLRSVSDRIADLDDWGLETTRRFLTSGPGPAPLASLPAAYAR